MKVWITGIAGVLGSSLAELLVSMGHTVAGNDIVRREEAWRLENIVDRLQYVWKSSFDLRTEDLVGVDVVVDCAAQPDRPLGDSSPTHTVYNNVLGALRLLEAVRIIGRKPIVVYPSSFNEYYALSYFDERSHPKPTSVYGYSKAAASMLYETYFRAYHVPVVISVVGSAYGPRMRSDELVANLILHGLKGKRFTLRSPEAKRCWTYSGDVAEFYRRLFEKVEGGEAFGVIGERLICAGNRGDRVITNVELANMVKKIVPLEYVVGDYEPGELVNGSPVDFTFRATYTRSLLDWAPRYSLEEGLKETAKWFKENLSNYKI